MRHRDAVALIAGAGLARPAPSVWVDLGSGDGTFTAALASLLAPGSVVHALDVDRAALSRIPTASGQVRIERHAIDFVSQPWPVDRIDGILMANSLHYVQAAGDFLAQCAGRLRLTGRLLLVEYDTDTATPWVPYPLSRARLASLLAGLGFSAQFLGSRPSAYRRASLYAAVAGRGIIA